VEVVFRVFVDDDVIYSGSFEEVPERYRRRLAEDLVTWADSLRVRSINELLYSHLAWYAKVLLRCAGCGWSDESWLNERQSREGVSCPSCGERLSVSRVHERREKLDRILSCIGMITRVEVSEVA